MNLAHISSKSFTNLSYIWIRYEKKYTEEAKAEIISVEKAQVESEKEVSLAGTICKPVTEATTQKNKKATSSTSDQDLDVFLLGEDSDDGPGTLFTLQHIFQQWIVLSLFRNSGKT